MNKNQNVSQTTKKQIIVPSLFFEVKHQVLKNTPSTLIKSREKNNFFENENASYIFNLCPSNKKLGYVEPKDNFFNNLNIKGDIVINSSNINQFKLMIHPLLDNHFPFNNHFDYFFSKKLTMKSNNFCSVYIFPDKYKHKGSIPNFTPLQLNELNIDCKVGSCHLDKIDTLNTIKIKDKSKLNEDGFIYNQIHICNCKNLKTIDLSESSSKTYRAFKLWNLNPECEIKFPKNFVFNHDLILPNTKYNPQEALNKFNFNCYMNKSYNLKELFNSKSYKIENDIITIKYKDWQKTWDDFITKYKNQQIQDNLQFIR